MARDYRQMIGGAGVWVPRWLVIVLVLGAAFWFGTRILLPPSWLVQQLDAPDGSRSARLYRSVYMQHHFRVKIRDGWFWKTAHFSPPLPDDLRVDLGERLRWSEDSRQVWLLVEGGPVWGFHFDRQRNLSSEELAALPRGTPTRLQP